MKKGGGDEVQTKPKEEAPPSTLKICFLVCGSVVSSVSLILCNKMVMRAYGFNFVLTLGTLHLITTALSMKVGLWMGFFQSKREMPYWDVVKMAALGVASIGLMNGSLQCNSVGFYQMTKLLCVPMLVIIQKNFYGATFSTKIYFSLAIITLGVGMATVTDQEMNPFGTLVGFLAILATAQFQTWQGSKQKEYALDAMQITELVSPVQAGFNLLLAVVLEYHGRDPAPNQYVFSHDSIVAILLTCVLAVGVNLFTYALIGKTSAVTYQVVGHLKTCLTLLGGTFLFPPPLPLTPARQVTNLAGVIVALTGMAIYGNVKSSEGAKIRDWLDDCCVPSVESIEERKEDAKDAI